jgi:hypothetical protein
MRHLADNFLIIVLKLFRYSGPHLFLWNNLVKDRLATLAEILFVLLDFNFHLVWHNLVEIAVDQFLVLDYWIRHCYFMFVQQVQLTQRSHMRVE